MPQKIKPPQVADEDNWPAETPWPRMVRCHHCKYWIEWRYVYEKHTHSGPPFNVGPIAGDLECWWCYMQRCHTESMVDLTWDDVKGFYGQTSRRVAHWQDLLSYATCQDPGAAISSCQHSASATRNEKKRSFDAMNAELKAFQNSGAAFSHTEAFSVNEDVQFRNADQYVGINVLEFEGKTCRLFNWASWTKSYTNFQLATLMDTVTGQTITKGRSLEGHIAAHNLCVISDSVTKFHLEQLLNLGDAFSALAIGGAYRDPSDPRRNSKRFSGVYLMGLCKHSYKPDGKWAAVHWKEIQLLLKGDHRGAVEGRPCAIRQSDNRGIAGFDGQSAMIFFHDRFFFYGRANPREAGYRTLQVCQFKSPKKDLGAFQLCNFIGIPEASDIYFMHPYAVPGNDEWIIALISLVWPEGDPTSAGIYLVVSKDGVTFLKPYLLHGCECNNRRAYDLPVQGSVSFTQTGIEFYVHQNVPKRMAPQHRDREEKLVRVFKDVPPHIKAVWSGIG